MLGTYNATRTFRAEMAHRLNGHEGKCQNLHGHSYVIHVTAHAARLDALGRVVDFGELKEGIGRWIADMLDHGTMLQDTDPLVEAVKADGSKLYLVPFPPTAENLAGLIGAKAAGIHPGLVITCVKVWETEHGMGEWRA